jgi:hypothetical protein
MNANASLQAHHVLANVGQEGEGDGDTENRGLSSGGGAGENNTKEREKARESSGFYFSL